MKFFQANGEGYGFEFNLREKQLFFKVLSLYPCVPAAHHRLSNDPSSSGYENQKLLEESLAVHREETRQMVRRLITDSGNFTARGSGFRWLASRADLEGVLQVLNEVRVGSWLALGSPNLQEVRTTPPRPDKEAGHWAMDIAGGFEMIFISALSGDLPVEMG